MQARAEARNEARIEERDVSNIEAVAFPEACLVGCPQFIDGEWTEGRGPELTVRDKFTGAALATGRAAEPAEVCRAIDAAEAAFRKGPAPAHERGAVLDRAAALLLDGREKFIALLQAEAGFTHADASGEVMRAAETLRLSAEEARRLTGEMVPFEGAPGQARRLGFTLRVPLGVVLAITPFNAPLNTVAHKLAPAFAAGNAVIVKPSTLTPLTAVRLAGLLQQAGAPRGFVQVLHGDGAVAQQAIADERVRFIAFTGSTGVGRKIQAAAGLRRTQMELGSIAFTLLCEDADLDAALPRIIAAGYRKAGQVCTSVQMLMVHRSRLHEVSERLGAMVRALAHGDPHAEGTFTGPLISEEAARRVELWVEEAIAQGATRLAGGPRKGAVVPPTLLADITPDMRVGRCEIFGPVICLRPFDDFNEAIAAVNATPFGLATGIFTNRLDLAFAAARQLEVGGVHINETSSSRVDLMPYGGSKDSGFGREGPHYAVREMTEERIVSFRA
ncbi:aldehyde dehydrogenase family protein [Alkalilacustris brevis]|uniref:aldehyde dehydrogenase family protein n=1 Tax=Alkalilacustris brevis TaxID=2026338 RepID=UPI000E0CDD7D|nr:aldehyde dehydrogenase family protein [Alkalilacustris brevis]